MPRDMEARTVVLSDDGRYVTLGRHSDPTEAEIEAAGQALVAQGLGGWLAKMYGNPWVGAAPFFTPLREVAPPRCAFNVASVLCVGLMIAARAEARRR